MCREGMPCRGVRIGTAVTAFGSTMRGIESAADRDNSATDPESDQRQSAEGVCFILLSGASCAVV